jgi:hypothetical protein
VIASACIDSEKPQVNVLLHTHTYHISLDTNEIIRNIYVLMCLFVCVCVYKTDITHIQWSCNKKSRKLSAKRTHQIPVDDTIAACMTMCRAGGPNQTTEQAY